MLDVTVVIHHEWSLTKVDPAAITNNRPLLQWPGYLLISWLQCPLPCSDQPC